MFEVQSLDDVLLENAQYNYHQILIVFHEMVLLYDLQ